MNIILISVMQANIYYAPEVGFYSKLILQLFNLTAKHLLLEQLICGNKAQSIANLSPSENVELLSTFNKIYGKESDFTIGQRPGGLQKQVLFECFICT